MNIATEIFKLDNLSFKVHNVIADKSGFDFTMRFDNVEEMFKFKNKICKMANKLKKEGKHEN